MLRIKLVRTLSVIAALLFAVSNAAAQSSTATLNATAFGQTPKPADIFQAVIKNLEGKRSAEITVTDADGYALGAKGGAKIRAQVNATLLFGKPVKFSSQAISGENVLHQFTTTDGILYRYSDQGVSKSYDVKKGYPAIPTITEALAGNRYLTPEYYQTALEKNTLVWGGNDEVENEPCDIVINISVAPNSTRTEFLWISKQTKLPRSWHGFFIVNGKSMAATRKFFTRIKFDVATKDELFAYVPTAKDSIAPDAVKPTTEASTNAVNLTGKELPAVELQTFDEANTRVPISKFKGKPTLITFWATWCGPCLSEMPIFQKVAADSGGKLQVVAVAAFDTKPALQKFIASKPEYKFEWLIDPDWQLASTRLSELYGLKGLPLNMFVDQNGKVLEQWLGSGTEAEIIARLNRLLKQTEQGK